MRARALVTRAVRRPGLVGSVATLFVVKEEGDYAFMDHAIGRV